MTLSEFMRTRSVAERMQFAEACGTTYLHVRNVAFSGKSCGPALAVAIERHSLGAVRRWELRRDDWHLIWPELIGAEGAPRVSQGVEQEARDAA